MAWLILIIGLIVPVSTFSVDVSEGERVEAETSLLEDLLAYAHQGDAKSQYRLALVYFYGIENVPANFPYALSWLEEAALNGHQPARMRLSAMLQN